MYEGEGVKLRSRIWTGVVKITHVGADLHITSRDGKFQQRIPFDRYLRKNFEAALARTPAVYMYAYVSPDGFLIFEEEATHSRF